MGVHAWVDACVLACVCVCATVVSMAPSSLSALALPPSICTGIDVYGARRQRLPSRRWRQSVMCNDASDCAVTVQWLYIGCCSDWPTTSKSTFGLHVWQHCLS